MNSHLLLTQLRTSATWDSPHASSHWQHYGKLGVGFGDYGGFDRHIHKWLLGAAGIVGRHSYRSFTKSIQSYPETWRFAKKLAQDAGFGLTYDVWKQAVALSILRDHWEDYSLHPKVFVMIGDGYGFLGALIRRVVSGRIYSIDLPAILPFQAETYMRVDPDARLSLSGDGDVVFLTPDDLEVVGGVVDCAVNIASMGEMKLTSIQSYFDFLRARSTATSRFYCVNREHKLLPGGEETFFDRYPWSASDEIYIDGYCGYYTRAWNSSFRRPFLKLDGSIRHRLLNLSEFE